MELYTYGLFLKFPTPIEFGQKCEAYWNNFNILKVNTDIKT